MEPSNNPVSPARQRVNQQQSCQACSCYQHTRQTSRLERPYSLQALISTIRPHGQYR